MKVNAAFATRFHENYLTSHRTYSNCVNIGPEMCINTFFFQDIKIIKKVSNIEHVLFGNRFTRYKFLYNPYTYFTLFFFASCSSIFDVWLLFYVTYTFDVTFCFQKWYLGEFIFYLICRIHYYNFS